MFEYSDRSPWHNSIAVHAIISLFLWGPTTAFLVYIAVETSSFSLILLTFSLSLLLGLMLLRRAQTNLTLPTVEVCHHHLILNSPTSKRNIYNLTHIEGARFFWHILYFRHQGWPIIMALPRMPEGMRQQLLQCIQTKPQNRSKTNDSITEPTKTT